MIGMPPGEGAIAGRASGPASDVEASAVPSGESRLRRASDVPLERGLRRELLQRRMVISVGRRVVRVASLHLLDGLLISLGLLVLSLTISAGAEASHYLPAVVAAFLLSLNAVGAYRSGDARRDRNRLASGAFVGTLILGFLSLFPPSLPFGPTFLTALGLTVFLLLALGRKVADQMVRTAYAHGIGLRRAIVVGNLTEVGDALRRLRDGQTIDQYLVGHVTPDRDPDPVALGVLSDLSPILAANDIQEVIVATSLASRSLQRLSNECAAQGASLYVIPSVVGRVRGWTEPVRLGSCPALHLHPVRLEAPSLLLKRVFDLVVAGIALPLLTPLIAAIALAIKIESPGPVFFRQTRVGLGGRRFTMWKFRSMYDGSDQQRTSLRQLNEYGSEHLFKVRDDPRITRVGRFLRRTSLDELPQLINVFLGDMSLVGPRPPLPSEVAEYRPHHFDRLSVVPGLTGPWQVGGRNLITDFERVVELERDYIRRWSLLLDAKIIYRTIGVVVRGEGAY
jgi:exopolysaccharide biosynthesis polyprenyl glycosylphosphotransferase